MASAVGRFLDYLQAECGLADNTRHAYRRDLRGFLGFLADAGCGRLGAVTTAHVEGFLRAGHAAGKNASSIARSLAAVRMFCRYCVLEGLMPADPSASVAPPRKWSLLPETLSREAVEVLLAAPDERADAHWQRDRALLTLLYATGMRASEAAGIRLADVNFDLGVVRVFGKGGRERIVPVADMAAALLREYVAGARAELAAAQERAELFLTRTGRAMGRIDIFRVVTKYVRKAGISSHASPHTLRHCFATELLAGGADIRSVQEMLGHADVATTQIYTHVDASRLKAIHRKFHPRG